MKLTRKCIQANLFIFSISSNEVNVLGEFQSMLAAEDLIEEGDPCVPSPWEWVTCSTNSPPRITKM